MGDLLVIHADDFQFIFAGGKTEFHALADSRIDERAGNRRTPTDPAAVDVGFIHAYDAIVGLLPYPVANDDRCAEPHNIFVLGRRLNHFGESQTFVNLRDALVHHGELAFRIRVIGQRGEPRTFLLGEMI